MYMAFLKMHNQCVFTGKRDGERAARRRNSWQCSCIILNSRNKKGISDCREMPRSGTIETATHGWGSEDARASEADT